MTQRRQCSQCGGVLAADGPADICPQCVLKLGLESEVHVSVAESTPRAPDSRPTPSAAADPGPTTPGSGGFTPPSVAELQKHFSHLEILELLGRGGMGAVYKARQPALDRFVALKILPPEVGRDPQFAERFTREARALAKLSHPNIVMVYDFGESDGLYYLSMEFVDGVNLRQTIRSGAMSPAEALKVVPQICEALQFAHEEGVVHRDIKPENILLDKRGRLKIADFGLAKLLGRADSDLLLTQTYQVMGTLHYMAPEQFERPTSVDHRADIYSLGVVFYELLTGQLPLGRYALPSEKVSIDARLDDVVLKTLEREPDRRYQHASDVKTDIETIAKNVLPQRTPALPEREPARPVVVTALPAARELTAAEWEQARRKAQAPAIGLMLAGILNFAPCLLGLLIPLAWFFTSGADHVENGDRGQSIEHAAPLDQIPRIAISALFGNYGQFPLAVMAWQDVPRPEAGRAMMGVGMGEILLLPFLLLSVPLGALMLLGGYKLRRLELYGLCLIAAVAALLPCSPSFLISFPIGIWALVVLFNPDIKAAFSQRPVLAEVVAEKPPPLVPSAALTPGDEAALQHGASQTIGPGNALVVVGVLNVLAVLGILLSGGYGELTSVRWTNVDSLEKVNIFGVSFGLAAALALGMTIVYGGLQMRARRSYAWALLASVLVVLPISPVCLLGFWVGAWSFFTLQASSVRRAFEAVRRRSPPAGFAKALPGLALVLGPPALVVAAGAAISILASAARPEPVGTILVYDVVMRSNEYGQQTAKDALDFCEARVNNGQRKIARVSLTYSGPGFGETLGTRIEIGVYGSDQVVANRIEERLLAQGKIEFAVLADSEIDKKIIDRAKAIAGTDVPAEGSTVSPPALVAHWVKVSHRAERQLQRPFGDYRDFASRASAEGPEVLVLVDPANVTEKEMSLARISQASSPAEPSILIAFNSEGARKMRSLTSRPENLSTPFKTRRMGIVVDGVLLTAPGLQSVIADQLEITRDFSLDEANDFVSLVRAGTPPQSIKQISRKVVAK